MLRVKGENEEEIVINRERYLSLLHELKVLRFKICRKKYWATEPDGKAICAGDMGKNQRM